MGVTGASGARYAQRLIELLTGADVEVHLVISPLGQRLLHDELEMQGVDVEQLAGDGRAERIALHPFRDVGASIASGSFRHDGMVIVPCSSNTLGCVAQGTAQNLLHRAAHVCLKERRKLILVHRETPLSLIDARNCVTVTEAGATVLPANPGFYMLPQTVEAVIDFVVARVLDHLDVEHELERWGG